MASVPDPEAENFAFGVEGQFGLAHVVPAMLVGLQGLGALARPFDRAAQLLRRPQGQPVLHVLPALGAEAAAHVAGDDVHVLLGHLEDVFGQHVPEPVGVLHVHMEHVAAAPSRRNSRASPGAPCTGRGAG